MIESYATPNWEQGGRVEGRKGEAGRGAEKSVKLNKNQ